jgi:hypothetical protein
MALGANRSDAVRLILKGDALLIICGIVVGMPLALAAGRFLGSQLYGVNPFSPWVTSIAVGTPGCRRWLLRWFPRFEPAASRRLRRCERTS